MVVFIFIKGAHIKVTEFEIEITRKYLTQESS